MAKEKKAKEEETEIVYVDQEEGLFSRIGKKALSGATQGFNPGFQGEYLQGFVFESEDEPEEIEASDVVEEVEASAEESEESSEDA